MKFLNPQLLWLLLVFPLFFGAWFFWGRRTQTLKNTQMDRRVGVQSQAAKWLTVSIWFCKVTMWTALVLGIASTSYHANEKVADSKGSLFFALDTSSSMVYGLSNNDEAKLAAIYDAKWGGWTYQRPSGAAPDFDSGKHANVPIRIEAALGSIKEISIKDKVLSIGLLAADDEVFYLYPETKNHELIIKMLPQIYEYVEHHSTGDNFCGPSGRETHLGLGPAAVKQFDQEEKDAPHILAFYSDGDFDCSPERLAYLKQEFARLNIHMIVFGVGEDWKTNGGEVPQFRAFLNLVGGQVFQLENPQEYRAGVERVEQLAQASVHRVPLDHRKDALIILLSIAGLALTGWLALSAIRGANL
ncbi:MAG TPA: hypothetical protein V6C81_10745 [Planktothrix sp.]|jgi:hypothetical protein